MKVVVLSFLVAVAMTLTGCAAKPAQVDYSNLMKAKPASILVLPPLNNSTEINATAGVWAHATRPLAEAGYYVLPVALVDETFRQNGVQTAFDAQAVSRKKLHEFFGADAALYTKIRQYGTTYKVITSETRVEIECRLVDLRTGVLLWQGEAVASSAEQQQSQGGLIAALVGALVSQIMNTTTDAAFNYAGIADARLLGAPRFNGLLYGPRSPNYGQPPKVE